MYDYAYHLMCMYDHMIFSQETWLSLYVEFMSLPGKVNGCYAASSTIDRF